jgi:polygalacturonase
MAGQKDENLKRLAGEASAPASPTRRTFMAFAGASAGASLLATLPGCGGGSGNNSGSGASGASAPSGASSPTTTADPIWGPNGSATTIINSLANITPSMFPSVDFPVGQYGAQPLPNSYLIYTSSLGSSYQGPLASAVAAPWGGAISWVNGAQTAASPQSPGSDIMVPYDVTGTAYDSYAAFNAAIAAANAAGGGRVVVPAGNWYCGGPIVLLSNVNFHLSSGAVIYFSPNPADYAKHGPYTVTNGPAGTGGNLYHMRWQANDCLNFGSPIYAFQQTNIAVTADDSSCVLNGQSMTPSQSVSTTTGLTCWWTMKASSGEYGYTAPATGAAAISQGDNNPNNASVTGGTANAYPAGGLTAFPSFSNASAATTFTIPTGSAEAGLQTTLIAELTQTTSKWGPYQDQNYLPILAQLGVPFTGRIFGNGHYLRPSMVELIGCTNVLLQNYQTQNTPMWQHHPTDCTNLVIDGVHVNSIGPNCDGFDPDACSNVLAQNMVFNTGDDCIAIKSGKYGDTEYGPTQNIVIQNCTMQSGHGGLTIGSEMSAGVQNVYARNLTMQNENWATNPLNIGLRFKSSMNRGGFIKNVYITDVTLPNGVNLTGKYGGGSLYGTGAGLETTYGIIGSGIVGTAANPSTNQGGIITFDFDYSPAGDNVRWSPTTISNVNISNVTATNVSSVPTGYSSTSGGLANGLNSCFQAIVAQGPEAVDYNGPSPLPTVSPISGVTISNCNFGTPVCPATGTGAVTTPTSTVTSATGVGPIFASNVSGIVLSNVVIAGNTYNQTLTAQAT